MPILICATVVSAQTETSPAPKADPATTQPATQPAPRSTAHATLNDFMELYRKGDPESKKEMVAYLDLSGLEEEARANAALLALRLAEFLENKKIATSARFEELKARPDAMEHCLFRSEPAAAAPAAGAEPPPPAGAAAAQAGAAQPPRGACLIRLAREAGPGGLWRFDAATVKRIPVLAAREAPAAEAPKPDETPAAAAPAAPAPAVRAVAPAYASPQATMRTFLNAVNPPKEGQVPSFVEAARCLNLADRGIHPGDRQAKIFAKALQFVLDRTVFVQFLELPENPDHPSPYVYRVIQNRWNIELERVDDGRWLFSAATLANLQPMLRAVVDSPPKVPGAPELSLRANPELWLFLKLPRGLQGSVGGLETWQWLGLLLVIFAGVLCDRVARLVLRRIAQWIARRLRGRADTRLEAGALRPIGFVILGYVWMEFFQWLWLPKTLGIILTNAAIFIVVVAGVWATYRVIDLVFGYLAILADRSASRFDVLLVPFGRKFLKVLVTVGGLVYFASRIYPERLTAVLGGLGLGGLAFALAAQETIKNVFGSITVMLDRPFEIGDWVKIGEVEGTVESVGFRSTRIRTFYNSQVNVPNGKLIDAIVDNLGRRRYRRIRCTLGLTYDTPPEKIEAFCEGVRELIRRHPYTRKDYYHVYFNGFGPHSLDVLLYCFHEAPDWGTELREKHRLFADILRLAERLGVSFAFPTQTLHLHRADGSPPPPVPEPARAMPPQMLGRCEAAAIAEQTVPPPETLGPVRIEPEPQPVDETYVKQRLKRQGGGG